MATSRTFKKKITLTKAVLYFIASLLNKNAKSPTFSSLQFLDFLRPSNIKILLVFRFFFLGMYLCVLCIGGGAGGTLI